MLETPADYIARAEHVLGLLLSTAPGCVWRERALGAYETAESDDGYRPASSRSAYYSISRYSVGLPGEQVDVPDECASREEAIDKQGLALVRCLRPRWPRDIELAQGEAAATARYEADYCAALVASRGRVLAVAADVDARYAVTLAAEVEAARVAAEAEAARVARETAERAARAEQLASALRLEIPADGGKRYRIEDLQTSGLVVLQEQVGIASGGRGRTLVASPLTTDWAVTWTATRDGQSTRRGRLTAGGISWSPVETAAAADEEIAPRPTGLTHSPFAALAARK